MKMEYTVRQEEPGDAEGVRYLLRKAFSTDAESKLVDLLRANSKAVIALVAVCAEDILGYILFSPVTTSPLGEAKGVGLAPVAVLPSVRSQGIGSQLILTGLHLCQGLGYDYCAVLGSPEYYHRFGFEAASRYSLANDYGVDEEFTVIRFSDRPLSGLVRYGPEFAMFSI